MSRIANKSIEALSEQLYGSIRELWNAAQQGKANKETYNEALIRWANETEDDNDDEHNITGS